MALGSLTELEMAMRYGVMSLVWFGVVCISYVWVASSFGLGGTTGVAQY